MSQQQDSESDSYYDGDDWRFFDGNLGSDIFDNDDLWILFLMVKERYSEPLRTEQIPELDR